MGPDRKTCAIPTADRNMAHHICMSLAGLVYFIFTDGTTWIVHSDIFVYSRIAISKLIALFLQQVQAQNLYLLYEESLAIKKPYLSILLRRFMSTYALLPKRYLI